MSRGVATLALDGARSGYGGIAALQGQFVSADKTRLEPASVPSERTVPIGPPPASPESPSVTPTPKKRDLPIELGTVIRERFELESVLGEGSMGVVYKAIDRLHQEMQDRDPYVAVKILSEQFKRHPNALIALQREVRRAQILAHENIIAVHSFDRDGPIVYMTMELLDGRSLRAVINDNVDGLPAGDVIPMIRGMAKALAYAHENEIVHADFKPGNVFLTSRDQIKVLDFGVARVARVDTGAAGNDSSSDAGEIRGMTPAYASPEVLNGHEPTPADDVFALAVVAYELLTGRHPFDRGPPDEIGLRRLGSVALPGLAAPQRRALARAFSGNRESRQQSAGEFLEEFDGPSKIKSAARVGIATMVALVPGVLLWMQNGDPGPAVPFESLRPELQQQFNEAVLEGETALSFGDAGINEALFYFSEAYSIHPSNPDAVRGLETVADRLLESIRTADVGTQRDVFDLLYCQDYLGAYRPVVDACEDLLGPECEQIARRCLAARIE